MDPLTLSLTEAALLFFRLLCSHGNNKLSTLPQSLPHPSHTPHLRIIFFLFLVFLHFDTFKKNSYVQFLLVL